MAYLLDQLENDLLACLCAMLVEEDRPVCACHHYAGESRPPADRCGMDGPRNGMAWLRRGTEAWRPTTAANQSWDGNFCGGGQNWETLIEIGVRRCIKAIQQEENAPDPDLYNQDRELLVADRHTLRRVLCCDAWTGETDYGFTITGASVAPLGPMGGCGGNVLQIVLAGDPSENDDPVTSVTLGVSAADNDPTGYTAQASWETTEVPIYVSRPAGEM